MNNKSSLPDDKIEDLPLDKKVSDNGQKNENSNSVSQNGNNSSDILGDIADLGLRFFILVIVSMLDCIECASECLLFASGKDFKWVLLVVFTYIPVSLFSPLLGYRTCITWQDAILAFVVTLIIFAVNGINKAALVVAVNKIKDVGNKVIEEGKEKYANRKK